MFTQCQFSLSCFPTKQQNCMFFASPPLFFADSNASIILYDFFSQKGTMFVRQFLAMRLKNVVSLFKSTFETEASIANNCNARKFVWMAFVPDINEQNRIQIRNALCTKLFDCHFWFILNSNADVVIIVEFIQFAICLCWNLFERSIAIGDFRGLQPQNHSHWTL